MSKWTAKSLKKLGVNVEPQPRYPIVAPEIGEMLWVLKSLGLEYQREYIFYPGRNFRADIYVKSLNLLIEYEGIMPNKKGSTGASRHTNIIGYTNDCEKYFLANVQGYKVLRLTALNYKKLSEYIKLLSNE